MSYTYYANGQLVELEVDEDVVAVRFTEPAEHSMRAAVAATANLAPFGERIELPDEKFTILPVAQIAKPRHERYLAAVAQLEQGDEVTRVAPVFKLGNKRAVATDRLLIGLKDTGKKARKLLRDRGLKVLEEFGDGAEFLVQLTPESDPFAMLAELQQLDEVAYVEPDLVIIGQHARRMVNPSAAGGDPLLPKQYATQITKAAEAWTSQQGRPEIKIAILDEGVDTQHEDLAAAIKGGYDATDNDEFQEPNQWDGHGTACAGLAAAVPNNDVGVRGIGAGCSLLAVRIAYSSEPGSDHWVTNNGWIRRGIDWAWRNGADVLSNSWGGGWPSTAITGAFERARTRGRNGKGSVIIIAAGNDSGPVTFPGTLPNVLTVSASNEFDEFKTQTSGDGEQWWGSNFGPEVTVAAPGVHNYTTDITGAGGYNGQANGHYVTNFNGTSSATPIVAGAAGLILSANDALGEAEVRTIIRDTADKVGSQPYFEGRNDQMGFGRLNVARAIATARNQNITPVVPATNGNPSVIGAPAMAQSLQDQLEQIVALTPEQRALLLDQALHLIDNYYVHLPLKRAMHAIDPVQRLKLLRNRLAGLSDRQFHSELLAIFNSLRDLHTNYLLPDPYRQMRVFLPFLIEEFYENDKRVFMASKVQTGFAHPTFKPGVILTHWNGVPIERAIALNADRNAGSNEDARYARGLERMTIRPLIMALPPEEEWVDVRYKAGVAIHDLRFVWQTLPPLTGDASEMSAGLGNLGLDIQTEAARLMKKELFAPTAVKIAEAVAQYRAGAAAGAAGPDLTKVSLLPDNFVFRTIDTPQGPVGYIRIYSFARREKLDTFVEEFVAEFQRILGLLPGNGLILDVRGNGGGFIQAGELILQFLTKERIQPEPFHLINTFATQQLCEQVPFMQDWQESIALSLQTGAAYSQSFPLTPPTLANQVGRIYQGPVVLVTDALCYSTTDIFAAGFQDHNIGPILGVHGNTGAGGANVWEHTFLHQLLGATGGFKPLPANANFRVSIRQCARVGRRAGLPVEDLGVRPDQRHAMTRRDLLEDNHDLILRAAALLFP